MGQKYPYKDEVIIKVYDCIEKKYKEEKVQAFLYSPDPGNFTITQDEIYRIALIYKVKIVDLVDSGKSTDLAFFKDYNYNCVTQNTYWAKVERHHATYKVMDPDGNLFFGSGSAGHDNISGWMYKASAYEIAHKRAKVNGIRHALRLFDYKIEGVEEDFKDAVIPDPVSVVYSSSTMEENNEKPSSMQLSALGKILTKIFINSGSINEDSGFIFDLISNNINEEKKSSLVKCIESISYEKDNSKYIEYIVGWIEDCLSKKDVANIIEKSGDFSITTRKPK